MAIVDTVMQLQQSGMTNDQIIQTLQSQGISPKEINEAINQAQIKNAMNQTEQSQLPEIEVPSPESQNLSQFQSQTNSQMQNNYEQSFQQGQQMQDNSMNNYQQQDYLQNYQQENYQDNNSQNQYYQDTNSADYQGDYYQQPTYDTETITEIAEQVISEKFKDFNEKNGDIAVFKSSMQDKVSDIDSRLKRIESTIDKLQQSIIQKIGEFGENTSQIKRDLSSLHDTTSKLMNPLIDNYRELQKVNNKK
jgi:hypothetical protein